ncbi:MAG TPA: helix-turn-helix domain-containing protein, partial [Candidatus Angelobacter sp.]|nr:helix-turn-helix domain-containing protein [Candidatus Angelobacter sp.]
MSAEATAYVTALRKCPDGAALNCAHKAVLWCLADHHNRSTRRCDPSQPLLSEESCVQRDSLKRALAYLDAHAVIARIRPENQGRGQVCSYVFLALDAPEELAHRLSRPGKGVHVAPFFSPSERGAEGVQIEPERGAEGVHGTQRNKEEPGTKSNLEPKAARARARTPL